MNLDHRKIARFYDDVYYKSLEPNSRRKTPWHLKKLARKLKLASDQTLLDIACGDGKWLEVARHHGASVSGIDISVKAIEHCKLLMPESEFHSGPAEELPFESRTFDLITCLGSLEHFLDQVSSLKEMVRVAKPDARILILVPNADFLTYRLGLFKGTQQKEVQETIRTINEWENLFELAGLRVVDRWKDLHVLNKRWITRRPAWMVPARLLQALMLLIWPIRWQYQIYFLCEPSLEQNNS